MIREEKGGGSIEVAKRNMGFKQAKRRMVTPKK